MQPDSERYPIPVLSEHWASTPVRSQCVKTKPIHNIVKSPTGFSDLEPLPPPLAISTSQPLRQPGNIFLPSPNAPTAGKAEVLRTEKARCRGCVHHHFHYHFDKEANFATETENAETRREQPRSESEQPFSWERDASGWLPSSEYTHEQPVLPQRHPSGHCRYSALGDRKEPSSRTHREDRSCTGPSRYRIPEEDANARRLSQATTVRESTEKSNKPHAQNSRTKSRKRKRRSRARSAEPKWRWMHHYIRPPW